MIDAIADYFLVKPQRITVLGNLLFRLGAALAFLAAVGRVATVGFTAITSVGGRTTPEVALAALYPGIPTWFVPESVTGFVGALLFMAAGAALTTTGKRLERWMNS